MRSRARDRYQRVEEALCARAEEWWRHLFPGARRINGHQLAVGDAYGGKGQSLRLEIAGPKKGQYYDFETGTGGGPLSFLWQLRGMTPRQALEYAEDWLGMEREVAHVEKVAVKGSGTAAWTSLPPEILEQMRYIWGDDAKPDLPPETAAAVVAQAPVVPHVGDPGPKARPATTTVPAGGAPTVVYRYRTADGEPWAEVRRWDTPEGKIIRPYRPDGTPGLPEGLRPPYRLPELLASRQPVVWAEGEKAAEALVEAGLCATTNISGAQSVARTDWSYLRERTVVLWPDNDEPGRQAAERMVTLLREAGVRAVHVVKVDDLPAKADAADVPVAERSRRVAEALGKPPVWRAPEKLRLSDWTLARYSGEPPVLDMLVDGLVPAGKPMLLASDGGIGKTLLALRLAWLVAYGSGRRTWLGGEVHGSGRVVVLSGEDDRDELHRRIAAVAGEGYAEAVLRDPSRIVMVPVAELDVQLDFLTGDPESGEVELSEGFRELLAQLEAMEDLALVVIDPLDAFALGKTDSSHAARLITKAMTLISVRTGATVLAVHHMRKRQGMAFESLDDVKEAIRGAAALVNGVRGAIALWRSGDVISAALVKANFGGTTDVIRLQRDSATGLLDAIEEESGGLPFHEAGRSDEPHDLLWHVIRIAAECGEPIQWRPTCTMPELLERLPDSLRRRLFSWRGLLARLQGTRDPHSGLPNVVLVRYKRRVYLDVPGGAMTRGAEPRYGGMLIADDRIARWWQDWCAGKRDHDAPF